MNVLYLLDANVLIDANRDYYPISRLPEFWDWLAEMGRLGFVKVPRENFEEVVHPKPPYSDPLIDWLEAHKEDLLLDEEVDPETVMHVVDEGYAGDLTDEEMEKLGRDPFLIAYALADVSNRTVVSTERSKPRKTRANRHVPDVCEGLHVECIETFSIHKAIGLSDGLEVGSLGGQHHIADAAGLPNV